MPGDLVALLNTKVFHTHEGQTDSQFEHLAADPVRADWMDEFESAIVTSSAGWRVAATRGSRRVRVDSEQRVPAPKHVC